MGRCLTDTTRTRRRCWTRSTRPGGSSPGVEAGAVRPVRRVLAAGRQFHPYEARSAARRANCTSAGCSADELFRTCGSIRRDGCATLARRGVARLWLHVPLYDPAIDAWRITWFEPRRPVEMHQIGRAVGADIVQMGEDHNGLLNRWRFVEITGQSFTWLGERSWDKGSTWTLPRRCTREGTADILWLIPRPERRNFSRDPSPNPSPRGLREFAQVRND